MVGSIARFHLSLINDQEVMVIVLPSYGEIAKKIISFSVQSKRRGIIAVAKDLTLISAHYHHAIDSPLIRQFHSLQAKNSNKPLDFRASN